MRAAACRTRSVQGSKPADSRRNGPLRRRHARRPDGWLGGSVRNCLIRSLLRPGRLGGWERPIQLATSVFASRIEHAHVQATGVVAQHRSAGPQHVVCAHSVVLAKSGCESKRLALASAMPDQAGLIGSRMTCSAAPTRMSAGLNDANRPELVHLGTLIPHRAVSVGTASPGRQSVSAGTGIPAACP